MTILMNDNNSAHDDITTTFTDDEYQPLIAKLKTLDKSGQLVKVLEVVKTINKANQLGDAIVNRQSVTLHHEGLGADICLNIVDVIDDIDEQNWLSVLNPLEHDLYDNPNANFTLADQQALENGDFELEFVKAAPLPSLSIAELFDSMELYALGRPSTYASIINALEQAQLIVFNPTTDSVKLTDAGLKLIATLKQLSPQLANATLSTQLQQQLSQVAAGFEMPKNVILNMVELIWDNKKRDEVADKLWLHIDEIYHADNIKGK